MSGNFSGKWASVKSEGWDAFMTKFNVPVDKIPQGLKVTEEITQDGDKITIKTSNNKDSKVEAVTINVGQNHKGKVAPGVEMEFTTAWDGGKLAMTKVGGTGGVTRELVGGQMLITVHTGDVVAKTYFDRA